MNAPQRRAWALSPDHVDLRGPAGAPASGLAGAPAGASQRTGIHLDARPQRLTLDPDRTAIIVIDMQNDFCTRGGWLDSIGVDTTAAAAAIPHLVRLLPLLRTAGVPVVWLNWGNRADLANLPPNVTHVYDPDGSGGGIGDRVAASDAVLRAGSWGAAIVDGLDVADDDLHVDKFRMSGFFDTPLDSILRQLRVDTVLFAGVNADQCVLATLTDAACLGYDVVLVEEASATTSPAFCLDATLYNVRQCFGFTTTPDAVAAAFDASAPLIDVPTDCLTLPTDPH
ncbi:cysteine hydrolase family protein [Plantibacter sp. Mn2098]|uniref:cysteine hydrolase family protein n=1 Tax=Plantibacter sp. Mn2098 TaxID=3395266 RepID=UPI003BDA4D8F